MTDGFSPAEIQHFEQGAFLNRIDPWAEAARYFRSIHSEIISALLTMTRQPLMQMGYVAEGHEPDIHIHREHDIPSRRWNYELAASEVLAEPGVLVEAESDVQALHIWRLDSGDLVTVVEIVSPGNKTRDHEITAYQERRSRLLLERGVNVVELDITRSVKRLTNNSISAEYPYHIAIFLPDEPVRMIGIPFEQPLSRMALPLRGEVIPIEIHDAYSRTYCQTTTAWHIHHEGRYTEDDLPFSTLLTDAQRREALERVKAWQDKLAELRGL